jgi:hypothetical protein
VAEHQSHNCDVAQGECIEDALIHRLDLRSTNLPSSRREIAEAISGLT